MTRHGLSLPEILVVVAIILVLLGLLGSLLPTATAQARMARCASNLRQVGMSILAYPSDNRGLLPPAMKNWANTWGPPYNADRGIIWQVLRDTGHFDEYGGATAEYQLHLHKLLRCPAGRRQNMGGDGVHYSATSALLGTIAEGNPLPLREVRRGERVVVSADVAHASFGWWPVWFNPASTYPANSNGVYTGWSAPHRSSTNWLLLDGHVENVRYRGTYYPNGARFTAINQPWRYDRPVNGIGGGSPAPLAGQYVWSRQQMRAAP